MAEEAAKKAPETAPAADGNERKKRFSGICIYIPDGDRELNEFIRSQRNLSFSVRLLIKAFMAGRLLDNPVEDAASMDMLDLIRRMQIDPDDAEMLEKDSLLGSRLFGGTPGASEERPAAAAAAPAAPSAPAEGDGDPASMMGGE